MEQPITTKNVGQPCVICGQAADAQATIAALQARVQELEEWKHIVTGAGTDQESVIRLAAYEYTKIAVQCWKEANARLESQLTQRTADLEAANKLLYKKNCALGRAETIINDLQAELERVRGERDKLALCGHDHSTQWWQVRYEELAALVVALPKVEGPVMEYYMADMKKHYDRQDCEAYAALLQHRQRMEG